MANVGKKALDGILTVADLEKRLRVGPKAIRSAIRAVGSKASRSAEHFASAKARSHDFSKEGEAMSRTDGHHDVNASAALVASYGYHCHDCGIDFSGDQLYVWDRQLQGGTAPRLLSADGRDPVSEDDLRCVCGSTDICVTSGD